jgi:hypothetical protein
VTRPPVVCKRVAEWCKRVAQWWLVQWPKAGGDQRTVVATRLVAVGTHGAAGHEEGRRAEELRVAEDQLPCAGALGCERRLWDGVERLQLRGQGARRAEVCRSRRLATRAARGEREELHLQSRALVGILWIGLRKQRPRRLCAEMQATAAVLYVRRCKQRQRILKGEGQEDGV